MRKGIGITGNQDGDEGKGRIVDYLTWLASLRTENNNNLNKPILVRRYQGGGNAGHTVLANDREYKLHQVPSGIITSGTFNLLGKRMYVNPRDLVKEIKKLREQETTITPGNLGIAANAHVTLDYHTADDVAAFSLKKHTSTGSGIKQTATDKYNRVGMRFIEFLDPQLMKEILAEKRFPEMFPTRFGSIDNFVESYSREREFLAPFIVQEHQVLKRHGTSYLFDEGAQGLGIDIDDGLYPGITSSNPILVPRESQKIVGVFKLYKSSVGTGDRPFVTQMPEELESVLRDIWGERGTKTGKNRDLGYFDIPTALYALDVIGVDFLAGTCGDRMEAFAKIGAKPKICVAYEIDGKKYEEWHPSFFRRDTLYKATPVLEECEPWEKFVEEDGQTLSKKAQKYVGRIEQLLGRQFDLLGTGPKRQDIIMRNNPLDY